jgi:cysteine desulfurase
MPYLDHAATTPLHESVKRKIIEELDTYGNPSSLHRLGLESERKITSAREKVATELSVSPSRVFFTSGGTEANNLILQGVLRGKKGHVITSAFEHSSVGDVLDAFNESFEITRLPVDELGRVRVEDVCAAIRQDTLLVSIMAINNETGAINPIAEIARELDDHPHRPFFHVDGIQMFGKFPIDLSRVGIDAFTFSGHKIGAPKGIGGCYIENPDKVPPLARGGGQEHKMRPGTENLLGILALGAAVEETVAKREQVNLRVATARDRLIEAIAVPDRIVNSADRQSPYILNIAFADIKAEVLLHMLEQEQIYVSTGSACHSKDASISHVIRALDLPEAYREGSLRFSFGADTDPEEMDRVARVLNEKVPFIRKFMKGKKA